ncbi:hypothetical protein A5893_14335 [Pedobacter psychrophilus]|uniref:Glycosyl transferase n=1 Tax=Pedobacter psychrophilus TaxID=1826909 RepID=A0A179DC87_9SPHI|nr:glycosyltransferase [Pedobacter psychrophilus]OAQ38588.1 hypothetical protein A5893_14335 [Pedobacter psychrophilus]
MANTVALFSDSNILPGTHATLTSLLIHNKIPEKLNIILFADKIQEHNKTELRETFRKFKKDHQTFEIRDAPNTFIKGANALKGNTTTYGRLYLADLLPDIHKLLYLDTDLIIQYDVINIFKEINDNNILFADGCNIREYAIDRELFRKAGLDMNGKCFNAGVLGMNLKKWREKDGLGICLETIKKYPNSFISADQAVLNVAFGNQFCALGAQINSSICWDNYYQVLPNDDKIFHFVGSPKPWDFLGDKIHYNFNLWKKYYDMSAIGTINYLKFTTVKRVLKLLPGYLKIQIKKHVTKP